MYLPYDPDVIVGVTAEAVYRIPQPGPLGKK
jgi:hypothetical protein